MSDIPGELLMKSAVHRAQGETQITEGFGSEPSLDISEQTISSWVRDYGDRLFRRALLRVRNRELAEDLVQETFLSAVKNAHSFEGRSAPYTWLTAILKNKIIDHLRRDSRVTMEEFTEETPNWHDELFTSLGLWKVWLKDWNEAPDALLERKRFVEVFDQCLLELPDRYRQAFALKVLDQVPTEEVCQIMNISPSNLWVILYRARMGLRKSLNEKWFKANEGE